MKLTYKELALATTLYGPTLRREREQYIAHCIRIVGNLEALDATLRSAT